MEINPLESGVSQSLDKQNINYSANKKANSGLVWAIAAAALLIIGLVVPQVTIIFVLVVCAISMYYTKSAKKDGATNLKMVKLASIVSTTVSVIAIIIFILNIIALGIHK